MDNCSCLVAPLDVTKLLTNFTISLVTLSVLLMSDLDVKKTPLRTVVLQFSCLVAPLCVTIFITIFTISLVTLSLLLKSDLDVQKPPLRTVCGTILVLSCTFRCNYIHNNLYNKFGHTFCAS
jgi:hypothetical protein